MPRAGCPTNAIRKRARDSWSATLASHGLVSATASSRTNRQANPRAVYQTLQELLRGDKHEAAYDLAVAAACRQRMNITSNQAGVARRDAGLIGPAPRHGRPSMAQCEAELCEAAEILTSAEMSSAFEITGLPGINGVRSLVLAKQLLRDAEAAVFWCGIVEPIEGEAGEEETPSCELPPALLPGIADSWRATAASAHGQPSLLRIKPDELLIEPQGQQPPAGQPLDELMASAPEVQTCADCYTTGAVTHDPLDGRSFCDRCWLAHDAPRFQMLSGARRSFSEAAANARRAAASNDDEEEEEALSPHPPCQRASKASREPSMSPVSTTSTQEEPSPQRAAPSSLQLHVLLPPDDLGAPCSTTAALTSCHGSTAETPQTGGGLNVMAFWEELATPAAMRSATAFSWLPDQYILCAPRCAR